MTDLYSVLDVPKTASKSAVKAGYHRAAKRAHPDSGGSSDRFALVKLAYDTLSDEEARQEYDRTGKTGGKAPDNKAQEAMQLALQAIDEVILEVERRGASPLEFDLLGDARRLLNLRQENLRKAFADGKRKAEQFRKLAKKFKPKKKGGPNHLGLMFNSRAADVDRALEQRDREKGIILAALDILSSHTFAADSGHGLGYPGGSRMYFVQV